MADHPSLRVVPIREKPVVSLADVPGRLRLLADQIESGEYEDIAGTIILMPRHDDFPIIAGYGNIEGEYSPITQLALASHWFIANRVSRV